MPISDAIFDRKGRDLISDRTFAALLGLLVFGGLLGTTTMAMLSYHWSLNIWMVLLLGLGLPILGIVISAKSDDPVISLFGYALVFIPFGILIGPVVAIFKITSVIQAVVITMGVAGAMWMLGMLFPPILKDYSMFIVGLLLVVVMGEFSRILLPAFGIKSALGVWWTWLVAAIFTGLILYDVNRAMQMPKTADNAVDAAVGIYLDILNLFLRVLELVGKKK
jgi:FtsH-binding integral membrane protein